MSKAPTTAEMMESLKRSGYLMEGRVMRLLLAEKMFVETGRQFLDPREGKSREIDLVGDWGARLMSVKPNVWVDSTFVIEAINNLYPVVLFTERPWNPRQFDEDLIPLVALPPPGKDSIDRDEYRVDPYVIKKVDRWTLFSQYCSFTVKGGERQWNRKKKDANDSSEYDSGILMAWHPDDLHSSIIKAVECALTLQADYKEKATTGSDFWGFLQWQPVIVLQNELYTLHVEETGEMSMTGTSEAKLAVTLHFRGEAKTVCVDFVTEKGITTYIKNAFALDSTLQRTVIEKRSEGQKPKVRISGPKIPR